MALIYRNNSLNRRTKGKKAKTPPKKPKFPKGAIRNKDGTLKTVSGPYNATLVTAHANNRFNETFGVDPETIGRTEILPNLNQFVAGALAAIAYNSTKAHDVTKSMILPQKSGWKRAKQHVGFREKYVLMHALRNVGDMLVQLRKDYMVSTAALAVECLEEDDVLWQNILEPLTGVVQTISDVMFRGHTDLLIHEVDGLKLARRIRIMGEELNVTAIMLDSMLGLSATTWTQRTALMAKETAKKWRSATITRCGLEDIYDPDASDQETDTVDVNRAKLWIEKKLKTPRFRGQSRSSQKNSTPTGKVGKGGPEAQAKDAAVASSSTTKPILKKAPKEPRTRGPSVFLPQKNVINEMERRQLERDKEYQELEEREYSERCAERTALENLEDDEDIVPTGSNRAYKAHMAARYSRQLHRGLQMNDQDMEMDPLRMAQIRGVSNTGSYLSYPAFPSAHLTDNRPKTEIAPVRSHRRPKDDKGKGPERHQKDVKGKGVERRSVLKKSTSGIQEKRSEKDELTLQQIGSSLEGIKNPEALVRLLEANDHMVTQAKGRFVAVESRVEMQVPPGRSEIDRISTTDGAKINGGSTKSKSTVQLEDGSIRVRTDENIRPRVRFEEASLPAGDGRDSRAYREAHANRVRSRRIGDETATSGRISREASSSGSSSRITGESRTSRSEKRSSTIRSAKRTSRNAGEAPTNPNGRFIRVGNDVIPAPLKIRQTRSQSPLLGKSSPGLPGESSLMPAPLKLGPRLRQAQLEKQRALEASEDLSERLIPLKLGRSGSKSPYENSGAGFPEGLSAMPAPLKLGQKKSQSPIESRGAEFPEGLSAMPAPLKLTKTKSKSPLGDYVAQFPQGSSTMLAPPKLGHKRAKSPLENRGVGSQGGSSFSAAELAKYRSPQPGPPPDRPLPPLPTDLE
ncbi:hypothetical protein VE01_05700 [Pseudogymnoascus verrucosus]|uniref:Uncharacterized protein n=1 Tax=Pseudogymnoascus verrucosus TaxID=342668 RepID=A0A1B8GKN9_9PEZI|nr:uncharacterized protein VE01_05700 [Pseudogymnoascus verrucosus]OBT96415.1 hypothetical protein VE01_05700 [Pseudogymnoascus verrucosus]